MRAFCTQKTETTYRHGSRSRAGRGVPHGASGSVDSAPAKLRRLGLLPEWGGSSMTIPEQGGGGPTWGWGSGLGPCRVAPQPGWCLRCGSSPLSWRRWRYRWVQSDPYPRSCPWPRCSCCSWKSWPSPPPARWWRPAARGTRSAGCFWPRGSSGSWLPRWTPTSATSRSPGRAGCPVGRWRPGPELGVDPRLQHPGAVLPAVSRRAPAGPALAGGAVAGRRRVDIGLGRQSVDAGSSDGGAGDCQPVGAARQRRAVAGGRGGGHSAARPDGGRRGRLAGRPLPPRRRGAAAAAQVAGTGRGRGGGRGRPCGCPRADRPGWARRRRRPVPGVDWGDPHRRGDRGAALPAVRHRRGHRQGDRACWPAWVHHRGVPDGGGRHRHGRGAGRRLEPRPCRGGHGPGGGGLPTVAGAAAAAGQAAGVRDPVGCRAAGGPVPATAWQSKKARTLLKILAARRGRATTREFLMEALWPEEPPEVVGRRLSVALATARAVLDPDKRHPPGHFIVAGKDALRLELANLPVDVERFLALAAEGLALYRQGRSDQARAALQAAEALYEGDFLEEDRYQDWAEPLREEARAAHISVARALGELAASGGDHDAAVRYYLRILERDAFDEQAHLGLVAALQRDGRHGEARRQYRAYTARMVELQVPAAPFPASKRA